MNKQRKVLITITYNEMGIIIDTKTEELGSSAQPEKRTEERTGTHACDSISRQAAIEKILGQPPEPHYPSWYAEQIKELPPAEPKRETTTLRIGRTRNSVTMWYECAECGEPVDQEDAFCRRCGREIIHE